MNPPQLEERHRKASVRACEALIEMAGRRLTPNEIEAIVVYVTTAVANVDFICRRSDEPPAPGTPRPALTFTAKDRESLIIALSLAHNDRTFA